MVLGGISQFFPLGLYVSPSLSLSLLPRWPRSHGNNNNHTRIHTLGATVRLLIFIYPHDIANPSSSAATLSSLVSVRHLLFRFSIPLGTDFGNSLEGEKQKTTFYKEEGWGEATDRVVWEKRREREENTQLLTNNACARAPARAAQQPDLLLAIGLLEFQIPPQVSRYASFLFSFVGRGAFYIFVGSILLHDGVLRVIAGALVGLVGVCYVVLEFIPSIEPPANMREADAGWGAEQV